MATKYCKQLQNSFRNDFHYMTNTNFGRGINLIRPTDKNNPTSTMSLTLDSSPKSDDSGVIITLSNIMNGIGISINMGYTEACMIADQIKEMYKESIGLTE